MSQFSEYEKVLAEVLCHKHPDLCCLIADGTDHTARKFADWVSSFGLERTIQLIELQCACLDKEVKPDVPIGITPIGLIVPIDTPPVKKEDKPVPPVVTPCGPLPAQGAWK